MPSASPRCCSHPRDDNSRFSLSSQRQAELIEAGRRGLGAGDPITLGLGQIFTPTGFAPPVNAFAEYDNLQLAISVPEPATLPLLAVGLVGFIGLGLRRAIG